MVQRVYSDYFSPYFAKIVNIFKQNHKKNQQKRRFLLMNTLIKKITGIDLDNLVQQPAPTGQ